MKRLAAGLALLTLILPLAGCATMWGVPRNTTADLRRLYHACELYAEAHDGLLPATMEDLRPYIRYSRQAKDYKLLVSGEFADLQAKPQTPVFRTRNRNMDGEYLVIFGDGRCGKVSGDFK